MILEINVSAGCSNLGERLPIKFPFHLPQAPQATQGTTRNWQIGLDADDLTF
jgi:hypothetical protein